MEQTEELCATRATRRAMLGDARAVRAERQEA